MAEVYAGLASRAGRDRGATPGRFALGTFALANGALSIAIVSVAAAVVNESLVFPSLGPTAYLLSYAPTDVTTTPRNIIVGHLLGVVAGYLALVVFGLLDAPSAFEADVTASRAAAAALSLGLTAAFMTWLDAAHPPAGATTLIVSLGILTTPHQVTALMIAVVFLAYQGIAINRLAGLRVPLWR
ncbi:MAG: HPP family protein [Actinobacteria bacterium]|nr:HPP family protein [Actinomycetota bacterium]